MHDDGFDAFLKKHAAGYRADAKPDADALWREIEAEARAEIRGGARSRSLPRVWLAIGAAIAATLVIGVFLGRWSQRGPATEAPPTTVASTAADSAQLAAHLRASTQDYLVDADVFLTEFRAGLRTGHLSALDRAQRSRELLARTRMLLHGTERQSPEVSRLLQDLELLLAEIAALPDSGRSTDAALLQETLHRDNIISRLRTRL